jgi:hypothetical protein
MMKLRPRVVVRKFSSFVPRIREENFRTKTTLEILNLLGPFGPEVRKRTRRKMMRTSVRDISLRRSHLRALDQTFVLS